MAQCTTCKGQKTVILPADKSPLGVAIEVDCSDCNGMGEIGLPGACPTCNGRKKVISRVSLLGNLILAEGDCLNCSASESPA